MKLIFEVRIDVGRVQSLEFPLCDGIEQGCGEGNGTRHLDVTCLGIFAGVTHGSILGEDAVGADQVGFKGPGEGIRVEVTQEDMHEEGTTQGELPDSDVGDVFGVFTVVSQILGFIGRGGVGGVLSTDQTLDVAGGPVVRARPDGKATGQSSR